MPNLSLKSTHKPVKAVQKKFAAGYPKDNIIFQRPDRAILYQESKLVMNNPDFTKRNIIAVEIDKVIDALTAKSFSRAHFLSSLNRFYGAIEETVATIDDFSQKQHFLNTVYEKFFQGFSVKVADTHGIVYTPQPIVNFMVKSEHELHCNEVMLLPYYIASMNIEHEYFEQTGSYKPFEGICLVDTLV